MQPARPRNVGDCLCQGSDVCVGRARWGAGPRRAGGAARPSACTSAVLLGHTHVTRACRRAHAQPRGKGFSPTSSVAPNLPALRAPPPPSLPDTHRGRGAAFSPGWMARRQGRGARPVGTWSLAGAPLPGGGAGAGRGACALGLGARAGGFLHPDSRLPSTPAARGSRPGRYPLGRRRRPAPPAALCLRRCGGAGWAGASRQRRRWCRESTSWEQARGGSRPHLCRPAPWSKLHFIKDYHFFTDALKAEQGRACRRAKPGGRSPALPPVLACSCDAPCPPRPRRVPRAARGGGLWRWGPRGQPLSWGSILSQHTLFREGVVSPGDLDLVMSDGLGMRYAFIGPLETMHLNAEGHERERSR
ncbi:lambda-crystallin homolog isoform X1 [Hippopotamus amphibius kiboko]|uniref:lambda-crystallin homolog isoform X1 n=1 Tax=Hippopotamus amphibius kiboko TaxID=575201 RepID=UPI0025918BA5|nr:lambda-crystallin homolog isoform X1 [Hippopotamus amphibius kiboko]